MRNGRRVVAAKRKDKPVCIRVTKAELERWRAAAAKDGRTLSGWIRCVTNKRERGLKP
jgi:hypothetical protein